MQSSRIDPLLGAVRGASRTPGTRQFGGSVSTLYCLREPGHFLVGHVLGGTRAWLHPYHRGRLVVHQQPPMRPSSCIPPICHLPDCSAGLSDSEATADSAGHAEPCGSCVDGVFTRCHICLPLLRGAGVGIHPTGRLHRTWPAGKSSGWHMLRSKSTSSGASSISLPPLVRKLRWTSMFKEGLPDQPIAQASALGTGCRTVHWGRG